MILRRTCVLVCLILLAIGSVHAQGPARSLSIAADRGLITAGEQVQIHARTRDISGVPRGDESFLWSSSNESVMTIDGSGLATGVGLGTATITAAIGGFRSTVSIEVLPLRVEVGAPWPEILVGQEMQLSAVALDVHGLPIPGVTFRWDVTGANGNQTRAAVISSTGLLTSMANGLVTARATVVYTNTQGNQVQNFRGITWVLMKPRLDFKLTRLLTNDPTERTFQIQPNYMTRVGSNDLGQIALVAPLDGITSGLMLYDNGRFDLLATAGSPGPQPGTFIWSFENPSVNNKGEVLVRALGMGNFPNSALLLATREGSNYVFLEGQSEGSLERLNNFATTRYSLNDNGEILFRAGFRYQGAQRVGLFKLVGGALQLLVSNDMPLPGLNSNYNFGFFGLDQSGTAYFIAFDSTRSALYKADGQSEPVRLFSTRESFAGSTVNYFAGSGRFGLSAEGTIVFNVGLANGTTVLARLRPTDTQATMKAMQWGAFDVFDVAPNGDAVFLGNASTGWGLYRWSGDQTVPALINNVMIDGGAIWTFYDAFITRTGDVLAQLITSKNDLVLYSATNSRVAFRAGTTVNFKANIDFLNPIPGARGNAPVNLLTGGQDASIYEWTPPAMKPLYVSGQRVVSDRSSWNLGSVVRDAAGDLYFTNSAGIFRYAAGRLETILRTNIPLIFDRFGTYRTLQWFQGWYQDTNPTLSVNTTGTLVFQAAQSDSGQIVGSFEAGRLSALAVLGGTAPTASPAGGFFEWGIGLAIDDNGRVMLNAMGRNGPSGLFIYEGGQWRSAAVINSTQVGGQTITAVYSIRAANQKFYAFFQTPNGGQALAVYNDNGSWTPLIKRGDIMPNGGELFSIQTRFDVNRNGDVALAGNMSGGMGILLRTADGVNHLVYLTSYPEGAVDPLVWFNNTAFDLRDDRRIHFTAIDNQDRNVLYVAEPLF